MGMSTEEEIVEALKKKNLSKYPDVSNSWKDLERGLWALCVTKDEDVQPRITAKTISYILLKLKELSSSEKALTNALRVQKDKMVKPTTDGGKTYYEILAYGKEHLKSIGGEKEIMFFSGKTQYDTIKDFERFTKRLSGELLIVDPHFGAGTLDCLRCFGDRKIRFLFGSIDPHNENEEDVKTRTKRLESQFQKIEIKRAPNPRDLHDRYIIADNAFVIVGHGFKDLGKDRESFIVILPLEKVQHFLPDLKQKFEERWAKGQNF